MSALGTKAIYIPVARLEFLSCNELSHSVYEQSLSHGNYFGRTYRSSGAGLMFMLGTNGAGCEGVSRLAGALGMLSSWWLALGHQFGGLCFIISVITWLNTGEKHSSSCQWSPPASVVCEGSAAGSPFKVNVKLIWKTSRALQLQGLLLSPLQNRSGGLLPEPWLSAWLTLDLCLLTISGVSCVLLWPFMQRTSPYCGHQLCRSICDARRMPAEVGGSIFPFTCLSQSALTVPMRWLAM